MNSTNASGIKLSFGWSGPYQPIWIIYLLIFLTVTLASLVNGLSFNMWMAFSMGAIALVFSMFKFFNLKAFTRDFSVYDVVAKRFPSYGKAYPFIEAGIGVSLISNFMVPIALIASVLVFGVGLIGVWGVIRKGEKIQCACVGKMFDLPLSRIAVFENGIMVGMSIVMLTFMA